MTGGIRTSVKGYLIAQRLNLATVPLSENETISNNVTAPVDPPSQPVEEMAMDSGTYGLSICDGNIPCFPMLNSGKSMASFMTRTRAESPPPQGVNLNSNIQSVLVPSSPQTEGDILQSFNLKSFHFNELKTATRNFRPDSLLGDGDFSSFYKGWIGEHSFAAAKPGTGMAIAVKRLKQRGTLQSDEEWMTEVNCLGQLVHPNIVKLIGYCLEDDSPLLVYEYMHNGSLERHLFNRGNPPLSWILRMKIAVGAAKGLAFLHSNQTNMKYGIFKTSKILLDINYNAKLYGYCLSDEGVDDIITRYEDCAEDLLNRVDEVAPWSIPTIPMEYVAPELKFGIEYTHNRKGPPTPKCDVYSFGVVMLEMLCGRRALDRNRLAGEHNLLEWAKPYLTNRRRVYHILDPRLPGQYSVAAACKAFDLAFQCLSTESKLRPDMKEVVTALEQIMEGAQNQRRNMNGTSNARTASRHRPSASRVNA